MAYEGVRPQLNSWGSSKMSMIERLRERRHAARRTRAIERALRSAKTPSVRDEILAIASRYYH